MARDRRPGPGAPVAPGGVAAHVIVESLEPDPASGLLHVDGGDAHHLESVLRLRPGEAVGATDGRGGYLRCRWAGSGRLEPEGSASYEPGRPAVTVALTPVKGDRPDWAVQKLTELGVDRIVVVEAARSVVRWDDRRAAGARERLGRIARAAVMQSRQRWVPEIAGPVPLAAVLGGADGHPGGPTGASAPGGLAMAEMGGPPPPAGLHTIVVGPEGGWSPAELAQAPALVGLGDPVLRAETAAVAAGVLLTALRSGLVAPAPGRAP